MGAYSKEARGGYPAPAAAAAAKTWALATPLALVLRGISCGYAPPTPFIAVAFVATGVLMIGWRTALAAATKPEVRSIRPSWYCMLTQPCRSTVGSTVLASL